MKTDLIQLTKKEIVGLDLAITLLMSSLSGISSEFITLSDEIEAELKKRKIQPAELHQPLKD